MGKGPHDSNETDSYAKLSWGSGLRKKERYPRRSMTRYVYLPRIGSCLDGAGYDCVSLAEYKRIMYIGEREWGEGDKAKWIEYESSHKSSNI